MAPLSPDLSPRGDRRTITDVVDDLGFGFAQVRLAILGGGINYTNGICLELISILPSSISSDLSLHAYERATMYSGALAGKLTGNFSAVLVNTSMGRRMPILIGYFLGSSAIIISASQHNIYFLTLCWFFVGYAMGFGGPNWWSLCSEASPTNKRMAVNAFSQILFSVGALVTLGTAWSFSSNLKFGPNWRAVILWAQISNVVLVLAAVFPGFVDSAHAYAARGKITEATNILQTMRQQNRHPDVSIEFEPESGALATETWFQSLLAGLSTMFCQQYVLITLVMFMLTFTLNFASYGLSYAMPMVLSSLDLGFPAILVMVVSESLMVLGLCSATFLSRMFGRRILILGPFLGCGALAFMVMAYGLYKIENTKTRDVDPLAVSMVLGASLIFKFIMAHGWLVVYLYATEVFPTVCRSSAVGCVLGMGRLGSIGTAYVFEALHEHTGSRAFFFGLVCLLMILDSIGSFLVLPETKGKKLEVFNTTDTENTPLKKT